MGRDEAQRRTAAGHRNLCVVGDPACLSQLVLNLCDAIGSTNNRLSTPCGKVLQHFAYGLQTSDLVRSTVREVEAAGNAEWKMRKIRRFL